MQKINWWYEFRLWLEGWRTVQEFRISKNCRWTGNFISPTEKFGTTSCTFDGNPTAVNYTTGTRNMDGSFTILEEEINQFLTNRFLRRN